MLWLVHVSTHPSTVDLGRLPGSTAFEPLEVHPDGQTFPGVLVLRFNAGLFFATADALQDRLRQAAVGDDGVRLSDVVIDFGGVNFIDSQGAATFKQIVITGQKTTSMFGSPRPGRGAGCSRSRGRNRRDRCRPRPPQPRRGGRQRYRMSWFAPIQEASFRGVRSPAVIVRGCVAATSPAMNNSRLTGSAPVSPRPRPRTHDGSGVPGCRECPPILHPQLLVRHWIGAQEDT